MITTMTDYCDSNGHIELIEEHIRRTKAAFNDAEQERPVPHVRPADIPEGWEEVAIEALHPRAEQLLEGAGQTSLKLGKTMKWVDIKETGINDIDPVEIGNSMMATVNGHLTMLSNTAMNHNGSIGHNKGCTIDLNAIEADTIMSALIWWDACRKAGPLPSALV